MVNNVRHSASPNYANGKPMRSRTARIVLLCLILLLAAGCKPRPESPMVQNGFIDLSSWDFEADGPVLLTGDWRVPLERR